MSKYLDILVSSSCSGENLQALVTASITFVYTDVGERIQGCIGRCVGRGRGIWKRMRLLTRLVCWCSFHDTI